MRLLPVIAVCVAFCCQICVAAPAAGVRNAITEISAANGTFTISDGRGGFKNYRLRPNAEVTLNGQKATPEDLRPGMIANVTTGEAGVASRLSVTSLGGAKVSGGKQAPAQSHVRVPATSTKEKPSVVGNVAAGQKVTIAATKVWWTGGGSKSKEYCDWRGYPGTNIEGKPWMALIARVGDASFAPDGSEFSFTVPADGVLTLYPNDGKPEGNIGNGDVTVTISSN